MNHPPLTAADQARIYQVLLSVDPELADRTASELAADRDPVARAVARLEVAMARELSQVRWLLGLSLLLMAALVGVDVVLRFGAGEPPQRGSVTIETPAPAAIREDAATWYAPEDTDPRTPDEPMPTL